MHLRHMSSLLVTSRPVGRMSFCFPMRNRCLLHTVHLPIILKSFMSVVLVWSDDIGNNMDTYKSSLICLYLYPLSLSDSRLRSYCKVFYHYRGLSWLFRSVPTSLTTGSMEDSSPILNIMLSSNNTIPDNAYFLNSYDQRSVIINNIVLTPSKTSVTNISTVRPFFAFTWMYV